MFYAIDAYPAYQDVAYQVAPAVAERAAKGFAAPDVPKSLSGQVAGARTHCVVRSQEGGGIAVCDDATIISFGSAHAAKARPASFQAATRGVDLSFNAMPGDALPVAGATKPIEGLDAAMPARRWFADLLMTFAAGFLLVSGFLLVTSRDLLPVRH